MYEYLATVIRVVDGDTLDLNISLGFETWRVSRARLASINAAEMSSSDPVQRALAKAAKDWLGMMLPAGTVIRARTYKDKREKYGRYLVEAFAYGNPVSLNDQLVEQGLAVPYMVEAHPILP